MGCFKSLKGSKGDSYAEIWGKNIPESKRMPMLRKNKKADVAGAE